MFKTLKNILAVAVSISLLTISNAVADGHGAAIKKWSNGEFSLSTISAKEREKELNWFHDAAKPFKGMEINVLSETIPTHEYESKVLTKAFEEITGIKVNHQLLEKTFYLNANFLKYLLTICISLYVNQP